MARKYNKLKRVLETSSPIELSKMTKAELREYQSILNKEYKKRAREFKRAGVGFALEDIESKAKLGTTKHAMEVFIGEVSQWLRRPTSDLKVWKKARRQRRKEIEGYLHRKFDNYDEYEKFARFMGAMQERQGEMWDKVSGKGIELYEQARRFNIDTSMIIENYDYWLEYTDKLEDIKSKDVHDKKSKIAKAHNSNDVAKILGFPSVKKFYKDLERKRKKNAKRRSKRK